MSFISALMYIICIILCRFIVINLPKKKRKKKKSMCVVSVILVCLFHMSDFCVCMRDVISELNSKIEGSLAFCTLMLFLYYIVFLKCSGSSLHVECI